MPPQSQLDPTENTDPVSGKVDEDLKLYFTKLQETEITDAAKEHSKFQEDWKRMFHRIMGQLSPEMTLRLMRSE